MCEQYVARAEEPFRIEELWPFTERLERYGSAGFGWGAAWLGRNGLLCNHRDVRAFRDDTAGTERVGAQETTALLVHLRRPSRLSTLQIADTQPFDDPAGRFSFSHNGEFRDWRPARAAFERQGRIHGRADTEVAERWLEDEWDEGHAPALLPRLHERLGGVANLALLAADGTPYHYAGNTDNPVFSFRLGKISVVSTGLYSLDRSLFRFAAHGATDRRLVRQASVIAIDRNGTTSATS
jgi:predicted glutamine amidotransferase